MPWVKDPQATSPRRYFNDTMTGYEILGYSEEWACYLNDRPIKGAEFHYLADAKNFCAAHERKARAGKARAGKPKSRKFRSIDDEWQSPG